jgi:hypothetical protein
MPPALWTLSLNGGAYTATVVVITPTKGVFEVAVVAKPGFFVLRDPVVLVNSQIVAGDTAVWAAHAQNAINAYIAAGGP